MSVKTGSFEKLQSLGENATVLKALWLQHQGRADKFLRDGALADTVRARIPACLMFSWDEKGDIYLSFISDAVRDREAEDIALSHRFEGIYAPDSVDEAKKMFTEARAHWYGMAGTIVRLVDTDSPVLLREFLCLPLFDAGGEVVGYINVDDEVIGRRDALNRSGWRHPYINTSRVAEYEYIDLELAPA